MKVAQSCPTLCDPMGSTVHGILQARILEEVAFPFSRGSSQPRDQTGISRIAHGFFTNWTTREAQEYWSGQPIPSPGDLPNPGIKLGSPTLHMDSLPTEPPGKPKNTGVGNLSLLHGIFPTQDQIRVSCIAGSLAKESACNAGDLGSIPGLGRSPGEGKGYPLQYYGLENSMDCIVHGVAKSQTWWSD